VVIYRGSDALYGWVFDSLQAAGLKLGGIALVALPVVAGWLRKDSTAMEYAKCMKAPNIHFGVSRPRT
jgi:hypothetical protein